MVYGHASGTDVPSLLDDVARFRELGYKAIRAQAAVPDVGGSYGVRKGADLRAGRRARCPTSSPGPPRRT